MSNQIRVFIIEQLGDASDWGAGYKWTCPKCGEEVRYFKGDPCFLECSCHTWTFVQYAGGKEKS